jgi:LysW-gamma-L-lysine carboxypeptidase
MDPEAETALLAGLLERYSPTGQEGEAAAFLVEQMQRLGFQAQVDEAGSPTGSLGTGPQEILLLGHIDTVPGFIPVTREGDILRGRGAVDAKGPLAGFVCAAARVRVPPGWRLTVAGAAGEEGDSRGARHLLKRSPPAMVIIGEPSGWDRVTLGYKGSAWFRYTAWRAEAHSASGQETACEAGVACWNDLRSAAEAYNEGRTRAFDQLALTLRKFNSQQDGFGQTAELEIGVRVPEGLTVAEVQALLDRSARGGQMELVDGVPAYRAEKNTPLVRALLAAIRASGGQPGFTLKTGTSDMNLAGPAWNCPIAAYGPGDSRLDHTPDERIALSEYQAGVRVLAGALERLMHE